MRALHAVVQTDGSGLTAGSAGAVVFGQCANLLGCNAADKGCALGWPLQGAAAQQVPAQCVAGQVVVVQPVMLNQFVHQGERQRAIGAGQQCNVFVALVGRFTLARVDADQFGALVLGLLRIAPEVQVAGDRVAAPDQYQSGFGKELQVHAELATERLRQRFGAGGGADRAVQQGSAQFMEEACGHALGLHQSHGAGVAIGQDGLRAVGAIRSDGLEASRNIAQRCFPTNGLKLARAFGSDALERLQDAIRVVSALGVARHLGTQCATGVRMLRVATHLDGNAVAHRGQQRAGVGAVVRAGAQDLGGHRNFR